MGRKALQGLSKNFCQLFLGYQIYADLPRLARLGRGHIAIDVLSARCQHDGHAIEPLRIATILAVWFRERLSQSRVAEQAIDTARLDVRFGTREEFAYRHEGRDCNMIVFEFECASVIEAFGHSFAAMDVGKRELA